MTHQPKEIDMNNIAEQFNAAHKSNLQTFEGLSTQAFAGIQKLVDLNMTASKALMDESFSHAQAVMEAKDPQEFLALQASSFKPMAEKSAAFFQHVQTIATDSTAEFSKAVEAKTAEAQKAFNGAIETLVKSAPAGTESAVAAFKSALTAGQSAVETAQTSAKKAVEVAQSNFTAVATQAADAVKKVSKAA